MRTSKPISTISYNSESFLKDTLDKWRKDGLIEFAMYIKHEPEADEKKAHFHVFVRPAKLIQTMDLELDSCEIDPENLDKPFKMIGFRVSNESDWLLYAIHEKNYLIEKGLERQHHYSLDDVKNTCEDTFRDIVSHVGDDRKGKLEYRIAELQRMGLSWGEIVSTGLIPIQRIAGAKIYFEALCGFNKDNQQSE